MPRLPVIRHFICSKVASFEQVFNLVPSDLQPHYGNVYLLDLDDTYILKSKHCWEFCENL